MTTYEFVQVHDDVWVEGAFYEALLAEISPPSLTFDVITPIITLGECTTLSWDVTHVDVTLLNGQSVPATHHETVCPLYDTTYTLTIEWVGGIQQQAITIDVE